jgi:hypothetical protein
VQRNVEDQRAGDPALWGALLGRGEATLVDHSGFQPPGHRRLGGEAPELVEDVVMINSVEDRVEYALEIAPSPTPFLSGRVVRHPIKFGEFDTPIGTSVIGQSTRHVESMPDPADQYLRTLR